MSNVNLAKTIKPRKQPSAQHSKAAPWDTVIRAVCGRLAGEAPPPKANHGWDKAIAKVAGTTRA